MADLAVRGDGFGAGRLNPVRAAARALADAWAAESDRRALWLPVFLGSGVALYFALTVEPPLWLGGALTTAFAAASWGLRRVRRQG